MLRYNVMLFEGVEFEIWSYLSSKWNWIRTHSCL